MAKTKSKAPSEIEIVEGKIGSAVETFRQAFITMTDEQLKTAVTIVNNYNERNCWFCIYWMKDITLKIIEDIQSVRKLK